MFEDWDNVYLDMQDPKYVVGFLCMCFIEKTNFQYWSGSISFFFHFSFSFPNWKGSEKPCFIKQKVWWPSLLKKAACFSQRNVSLSIFCTIFNLYRMISDWNYEKLITFVPGLLVVLCVWNGNDRKEKFQKCQDLN